MFDSVLNALWSAILPAIVAAILAVFGLGCNAQGALDNGKLRVHYQPAIIWRVDTGLWFNGASNDLIALNGDVEGTTETVEAEPEPVADDGE